MSNPEILFQTAPDQYKHWGLDIAGPVATLSMDVQEDETLAEGYKLKLNSYDLGVDIELADVVQRIRFEHPEVRAVVVTSLKPRIFCAGANIFMLGSSSHAFKVNFCKFTNETRLYIEDASAASGLKFLAALNGTAAGGARARRPTSCPSPPRRRRCRSPRCRCSAFSRERAASRASPTSAVCAATS